MEITLNFGDEPSKSYVIWNPDIAAAIRSLIQADALAHKVSQTKNTTLQESNQNTVLQESNPDYLNSRTKKIAKKLKSAISNPPTKIKEEIIHFQASEIENQDLNEQTSDIEESRQHSIEDLSNQDSNHEGNLRRVFSQSNSSDVHMELKTFPESCKVKTFLNREENLELKSPNGLASSLTRSNVKKEPIEVLSSDNDISLATLNKDQMLFQMLDRPDSLSNSESSNQEAQKITTSALVLDSQSKKFICQDCKMLFRQKFELVKHMDVVHRGQEFPFKCKHCGDMFSVLKQLQVNKLVQNMNGMLRHSLGGEVIFFS